MFTKILAGTGIAAVLFAAIVSAQPDTFHVERSIVVGTEPERAFAQVNDFHAWTAWSPWEKKDPGMQRSYSGPSAGKGASYAWHGNKEIGEGRMTIERSEAPSAIGIRLEFIKPFAATNTATYTFVAVPGGTKVTWAMDGNSNFIAKGIHLFLNMDKLVGGEFERGLADLKAVAEASPRAEAESATR